MGNFDHGTTYMRAGGDDRGLRPWHYIYMYSIESRLIRPGDFASGFKVSGFRFRVSGLGFRVSGFRFWVSGFGLMLKGLGVTVVSAARPPPQWDLRFRGQGSCFVFQVFTFCDQA